MSGVTSSSNLPQWMAEYSMATVDNESFSIGTPMAIEGPHDGMLRIASDHANEVRASRQGTANHIAVIGRSGTGKSRFTLGLAQDAFLAGHGGAIFDNNGMLPYDMVAWVAGQYALTGDRQFIDRIHVIDPSPDRVHSEQPLQCPPEYRDGVAFDWWRQTQCDQYLETLLRAATAEEREIMKRLFRHSGNFFRLIATPDPHGNQLSPADVFVVMNVRDPDHDLVYERMKARLPRSVRNDFEQLHVLRSRNRDHDIDRMLESTHNMITKAIDVTMDAIYSRPNVPVVPYEEIITEGHWALFCGRPNQVRSTRAMSNVTDLAFRQIRQTASRLTEQGRQRLFYLLIDEPGNSSLAGPDLPASYELCRATGIALVTLWQDRSTFCVGEHDLFHPVVNNSDTVLCFQQKLPDPEIIRYFRLPATQLEERMHEVDRPDPARDEVVTMQNGSHSVSRGGARSNSQSATEGVAEGTSAGLSIVKNRSQSTASMRVESVSQGEQSSWSDAQGSGQSDAYGESTGIGQSFNTLVIDGRTVQIPTQSHTAGGNVSSGVSSFDSHAKGGGTSRNVGVATGLTNSTGSGTSVARMLGSILSKSKSRSRTESTSDNWAEANSEGWSQALVQRTRVDVQPTGSPRFDLTYQDGIIEYLLAVLPPRYFLCRGRFDGREQTILLRSNDVSDPFEDQVEREEVVKQYLAALYATKTYLFKPEPAEVAREKRLQQFRVAKPNSLREENPDNDHFNFG